jgi:hypothetical protein
MTMTAAEHFEKAEQLLEDADRYSGDERRGEWVTRAQAHFAAARLLLDIEITLNGSGPMAPARRSGLEEIARKRRADDSA